MQFPVYIQGMEGQQVTILAPTVTTGPKLLVNGMPAMPGAVKNEYVLQLNTGQQVIAHVTPGFFDPAPKLTINGYPIAVARPFQWYEWMIMCVPLILIGFGGALGGGLGAAAAVANGFVLRSTMPAALRYLAAMGITAVAIVGYLIVAAAFAVAIHRH